MIALYCRRHHGRWHHGSRIMCAGCGELLEYALLRLDKCPFQEGKTTCAKCPVHCYRPAMREGIRGVMKYAGPRMLLRHPVMAVQHLLDARRKKPRDRKLF
jgi:hypothetical protein